MLQGLPPLNFKRPANKKNLNFERVLESFGGLNATELIEVVKQNSSKLLGMSGTEMTKFAAWLRARLEESGYSLPGWDEAGSAAAQIRLITTGELPVQMVGEGMAVAGVAGPSTAVRKRKGEVKAAAGPPTGGEGSEDEGADTEEEESEEEVKVKKRTKKKPDATNALLLQLAQTVGELQEKVDKMSSDKGGRGLIATLSERAGLEEKKPSRKKRSKGSKKKTKRASESSEDESETSSSDESTGTETESDSDEDHRSKKKSRSTKRRLAAEKANVIVPISGLKLKLNVSSEDRLAATTLLKWYTKYGTLSNMIEQSPVFEGSKVARNKHEARSWARMMDLMINEIGWKRAVKMRSMEVVARRLLALELASERNNNWDVASLLEENHVGHDIDETAQINRALKTLKLKTSLGSHTQRDEKGAAGGK